MLLPGKRLLLLAVDDSALRAVDRPAGEQHVSDPQEPDGRLVPSASPTRRPLCHPARPSAGLTDGLIGLGAAIAVRCAPGGGDPGSAAVVAAIAGDVRR